MGDRERHGAGIFFCGTAGVDLPAILAGDDVERDAVRLLVDGAGRVYEFTSLPAIGPDASLTCLSIALLPAGTAAPWRGLVVGTYVVTLAPLTERQLAERNVHDGVVEIEQLRHADAGGRHYWQLRNVWINSITRAYEPLDVDTGNGPAP